jgi:cation diffusion facilitator family transporter
VSHQGGTKAIVAAMSANLAIAVMKFVAWAVTGAASLLAEAIHSVADSANQIIMLLGGKRAQKAATAKHPFGFGRERYISAFLVAIILFSMGGLFAMYEAYHKFLDVLHGEPSELLESKWWWIAIVVLVGAIVAEGMSFRTAWHETKKASGGEGLVTFIRSSRAPELPVILLEDTAALTGLVLALLGVGLTKVTGIGYFDVIGSGLIGLLLLAVAIILAVEIQSLLVGESARPEVLDQIAAAITATPLFTGLIYLKTVHIGPETILVAAKVAIAPDTTATALADAIDDAEARIRAAVAEVGPIYLEPDIWREDEATAGRDGAPEDEAAEPVDEVAS